jgi:hypothetical protein
MYRIIPRLQIDKKVSKNKIIPFELLEDDSDDELEMQNEIIEEPIAEEPIIGGLTASGCRASEEQTDILQFQELKPLRMQKEMKRRNQSV